MRKRFEVNPRPVQFGGGWTLLLFDTLGGRECEVGRYVYPEEDYTEALEAGEEWVNAQRGA
jgi:hypothetical protein